MDTVIRPETSDDSAAVREIVASSFPTHAEARLVDALRANGKASISLVAEHEGQIVGHILFSPVTTSPPSKPQGLGLAPVAVASAYRSRGIGSALIREGLRLCRCDFVVVLGSPEYYSRFGFQKASQYGLQNEYGMDSEFMVMEITHGALQEVSGLVKYALEFGLFAV
jgi:putative acetyltransferase